MDEYYDKITGNPKYALHGMCNPLMIWQQRKAETDGLDAYKARNIYYHSIFDDLVKINNRIIVDEPTLRRGLIKTILYHDKGLSDRISRIYEFWNMEQLLDASRDSSFDCIVFPNYCNSHNSVVCSLSCGYNRFPLVEHDPRYTLIVRDILYWETARSLWTQYLKAIPGKEEKVKRAIRGILADYEKEERDIIYLESKNHCVLVHLDGIRQTPEGSPSFYATLDEAEHEFASSAFLRIHKSYLINGDHILQMSNYKVLLDTGMTLKGSRKYFSKAKLEFYRGR